MGTNHSEFKCRYNKEYFDRFDYCSPDEDPYQNDPENTKNLKTPQFRDFGSKFLIYRRRLDWQQPGNLEGPANHASPRILSKADNTHFLKQAVQLQGAFVNYTAQRAWECLNTYENSSPELCINEFKRHLFLTDREIKWKFGSLMFYHGIDPVARIPEHLKYESDEFKMWLEQNAMSLMFPLYLHDYVKELNEY
eukprot:CAMPEP_0117455852 /NCGR_PEP_ID=MMETSP0759-20121206/11576_1 /TAXON_ID=63605 /ORGANISM="Percolomonas cosmopolitus, Strain WS" /LENGTH=193 /DNA_ID=CAMNT_0005249175 /DNA_START=285 /DNA_END=866 /DNA_ORIENTATION=+